MATPAKRTRRSKPYPALVEELRQRCAGEVRGGVVFATHGGAEFQVRVLPKEQGFVVSVPCRPAGRFKVTRKGELDRRMETFLPAIRFHAHDARFDDEFNVHTRDSSLASAVLTRKPIRGAVRQLFAHGVHAVGLAGDRVSGTCSAKAFGGRPVVEDVLGLAEELAVIAGAVTTAASRGRAHAPRRRDLALVGAWTTLGLLGVLGLTMLIAGSIHFTLVQPARFLLPSAIFGLPAVALVVFALVLLVQHRSAPYGLVRGLTGVSLLVVPLFVSGALLVSNGLFDSTPADEHVVTVVGKNIKKNKDELSYRAGLASWWTEGDVRWVKVSQETYDELESNLSRMRVRTHPGKLGYAWIENTELLP